MNWTPFSTKPPLQKELLIKLTDPSTMALGFAFRDGLGQVFITIPKFHETYPLFSPELVGWILGDDLMELPTDGTASDPSLAT